MLQYNLFYNELWVQDEMERPFNRKFNIGNTAENEI